MDMSAVCDDALLEILVRLPSKSVLRCRAVCKSWRRITTARSFLAAHAARRPRQMLVITDQSWTVSAVPLSLYPAPAPDDDNDGMGRRGYLCDLVSCDLLASLDGLLLLRLSPGHFILCNPTTRQWSKLPALLPTKPRSVVYPCGFYFHSSSGEYRLLCHYVEASASKTTASSPDSSWEEYYYTDYYYIISTDGDPRRLARATANRRTAYDYEYPVACREILHWCAFRPEATSTGKILAFHTINETFRLVARPPCNNTSMALLELEGALCAVAFEDATFLNIWILQDYESEKWMLRNHVQVMVKAHRNLLGYNNELLVSWAIYDGRDTILIGHPYLPRLVRLCDLKEKKVRTQMDTVSYPTFLVFSESLVSHAFFEPPLCFELGPVKICD